MSTVGGTSLQDALEELLAVATRAGVDTGVARTEALQLAAALAESAPKASVDWAAVQPGATTQDFFDAAVRGRRWRGAPTAILADLIAQGSAEKIPYAEALAEVASAACALGEPTMRVVGNASVAAAAQLQAAGARPLRVGTSPASTGISGPQPGSAGDPQAAVSPAQQAEVQTAADAVPAEPEKSVEELLAELDALTGLERVKREVHRQVAVLRVEKLRTEAGLKSPTITRHLVFVGNPGTGKTTVARLVSGIYKALGLLSKGQLVEVDRSELVAGYLGQTATKTADVVASAAGGVLFIDEAYSLTAGDTGADQYGREAVDTLVKEMEDRRDDLVVIVAGYPEPMEAFVAANPGLASRFRTTIGFDDYTDDELTDILTGLAGAADYELDAAALEQFRVILASTPRNRSFGNGRFARNVLEAAIGRHAWRLRDVTAPTTDQLRRILAEDLTDEALVPPAPVDKAPVADELSSTETTAPDEATAPDAATAPDEATSEAERDAADDRPDRPEQGEQA
ncbi:ATPase family protein associated with various cellular activities (AAA) [Kribbella amoyensis]|uniref:ATPase family protein associated with various cellular activities (AAA) n=1 Tax=Kribbella amoyensis TaxID=996641 RepID=A0A561BKF4_9ACTN|nr:AAA family ATPase [Kribbella amoyensis]TWD79341.1 ATPase family protein associated with various cellular activities (AAA) [Kribbella amoyensis]